MSRLTGMITLVVSVALLMAATGCQEKAEGMSTADQNAQAMADQMGKLQAELDRAQRDKAASDSQMAALRDELNRLRQAKRAEPASPAPGWQSVPGGAMTSIEGTLLFDSGKATLKPGAAETLQRVTDTLKAKFPNADVYVFGHTDAEPIRKSKWKDNYELSAQRALTVVRELRSEGVEQNMAAAGWGEQRPVAENSSATARQANRRVEIYAMAPQRAVGGTANTAPPTGAGEAP
jgi:chemotaxis protein MotB